MDTEPSEMSFSLSLDSGRLEWASHSLATVFAQKRNLLSPSFWRMVLDVVRFGRQAPKVALHRTVRLQIVHQLGSSQRGRCLAGADIGLGSAASAVWWQWPQAHKMPQACQSLP